MRLVQRSTPNIAPKGGSASMRAVLGTGPTGPTGATGPTGPIGPPGPGTGAGAWQATTAYTAGQVVQAPDGSMISRNATGTSRASFDATEKGGWTAVLAKSGTVEADALSASTAEQSIARVTPTKHAPALGLYFPEAEGAVGDGVADDTAAVVAAFAAATAAKRTGIGPNIFEPGGTVHLQGSYNLATLSAAIVAVCNISGEHGTIIVPNAYAGTALLIGHDTSGKILMGAKVDVPTVTKAAPTSLTAGSVGVQIQNLYSSHLRFQRVSYFETAHWYTGLGEGTCYNTIHPGWVSYAKIGHQLKPRTAGWVNQNSWYGGGIQQSPSFDGGGLRRTGWRHLVLDGAGINTVTGNNWYGTSFEGDVSEYVFTIAHAYDNNWYGTRHEQGTTPSAVTVSGDTLTKTGHGLSVGDKLFMNATAAPTGMYVGVPYFVVTVPDADTFKIGQKKGGAAVTFSTAGTGVTYLRPQRILLDPTIACFNNVIRDHMSVLGFLEIINTTGGGGGNGVDGATRRLADDYNSDGRPTFMGRNHNATPTRRPIFAAYPATANPDEDPHGWTTAIADTGVVFQSSAGVEQGRLTQTSGAITWRRPADSADFYVASCQRTQSATNLASGTTYTANSSSSTATVTLTGAAVGDYVTVASGSGVLLPRGLRIEAQVTATNTITYRVDNNTAADITLAQTIALYFMVSRRFF